MKKKRGERTIYSDVRILDIAEEGRGVAKVDNLVLFIPHAVPQDIVDVELVRKKRSFGDARLLDIKTASPERVAPFCAHFGICGGCKWQHMQYSGQLRYKQATVENALRRIGKIDFDQVEPILPSPKITYYRNKLEYTFSNKSWLTTDEIKTNIDYDRKALGFHVPQRFDKILQIDHCFLQPDPSNHIRNQLDSFAKENKISYYDLRQHTGELRNLIIRTTLTGEVMVLVVFAYPQTGSVEKVMSFLKSQFIDITSLLYVINQKRNDTIFDQKVHLYAGREYIVEKMGDLKFRIGPKTFYQTNSEQAYELYKLAASMAELKTHDLVYDLYTGAGTIANFIARHVNKVVGIEYVESAIEDARANAKMNGIKNTNFFAGDMKDVLTKEFVEEQGHPTLIITDPPRAGMHPDVIARLIEIEAEKIIYISCNVATQARDIALLSSRYTVEKIVPVDMFPQTQHVENVVLLKLIKDGDQ